MPVILSTDLIIYFVFFIMLWFALSIRKQASAAELWRRIKGSRLVKVSTAVLFLFLLIALLDSIRWRDAESTAGGKRVFSPQALSLLDRTLSHMRENTEKTFSSPFSSRLYVKETFETAEGAAVRGYPPLKYPRQHYLGTDKVGRDVLFSALKGIRTGMVIGAGATIVVIPFAIFFGVLAGYYGKATDDIIQYIYTTLSSIPAVLLIVAFMLIFSTEGYQGGIVTDDDLTIGVFVINERLFWLCLIMGITSWTDLCRLIRGETLKLRELEYIEAARAFGVSDFRIISRHIVPNLMHIVVITAALQFSGLVLAEAILSYIGIGVGPEVGSWGAMINNARLELSREPVVWWGLAGAFVFMFALVLAANILADAVRDALDPRLRMRKR
jgi:peptide/nickel transport system permease protein